MGPGGRSGRGRGSSESGVSDGSGTGVDVKHIFLVRHAKSSWKDEGVADHERPLAPRGRRATKVIAKYLSRQGIAPALVLCSSARRSKQTLEGIAPALGDRIDVRIESGLYSASAHGLLDRLQAVPEGTPSVMLVGHSPAIERLTLDLARGGGELASLARKFPTGALATLQFAGTWSDLKPTAAELVDFVKPRDLE